MYIARIAGVVFLPISIIVFLDYFQFANIPSILGINILLLAAFGIIIVEIGDIIDAHIKSEYVILNWIVCPLLCLPAILFFLSKFMAISASVLNSLPLIMASFLFVE